MVKDLDFFIVDDYTIFTLSQGQGNSSFYKKKITKKIKVRKKLLDFQN